MLSLQWPSRGRVCLSRRVSAQRGVSAEGVSAEGVSAEGVSAEGVSARGRGCLPKEVGVSAGGVCPTDRMTDRCKNITLP